MFQHHLSRELVVLDNEVAPFSGIDNVEEFSWQNPDESKMIPLFRELEFDSLLDTFALASNSSADSEDYLEDKDYHVVSESSLQQFVSELSEVDCFAFDTETSALDFKQCDLVGISFSWKPISGFLQKKNRNFPYLITGYEPK